MIRFGFLALSIAALAALQATTLAQESVPKLDSLSFLTGRWTDETPNEYQEEVWSPLRAQNITGQFRILHQGKPVFYEFWSVEIDHDIPVLLLKHFGSGLIGREDKDKSTRMLLKKLSAEDVLFEQEDGSATLYYKRTGDTLTCTVHHARTGKDEVFHLHRQP